MKRQTFIRSGLMGVSCLAISPLLGRGSNQDELEGIDMTTIEEFVLAGHNNLDKVKRMLREEPNLIYARHDWGGGDLEEAIEGAGHLGNVEIASYLIEKGARVNLFVLTMLGKSDIVIPTLKTYPSLIRAKGAHGFSLLYHAKVGGARSQEIFDYLTEEGLEELKFEIH